jgi:exonuclease SbcD
MKLAHLADLHLGFRQYTRLTPQGINQREADVAQAFRRMLDDVAGARPDVVVIAGDLFHSVRPTNAAILDSFQQLRRFRAQLPDSPIVVVAGNHDTPRSVETGTILKLFEAVDGVHVAAHEPRRLVFERLGLAVLCVPYIAWSQSPRPVIARDPGCARNVLVTHREVEGVLPYEAQVALGYGAEPIRRADLQRDEFDYVALGHYHVPTRVDANVYYAGGSEYVTTNPWGESAERGVAAAPGAKGWLLVELGKRLKVTFRPIPLARRVIDLEPLHGAGLSAAELDRAIGDRIAAVDGGIDGQIVRQVVFDVARLTARDLDHSAIRDYKTRALHYRLDLRRPAPRREVGVGGAGRRQTLPEVLEEYLRARALPPEVPRERLVALGRELLAEAEAVESS